MDQTLSQEKTRARRWKAKALGAVILLLVGVLGVIAIVPAVSPASGAQIADMIRSVAGPRPVAGLESISFRMQDAYNQFISSFNGGQKKITLAQSDASAAPKKDRQIITIVDSTTKIAPSQTPIQTPAQPTQPVYDAVSAPPQIGWQPYGPVVGGSYEMSQAMLSLDPKRTYAGIALVRIDLSKLKLNMEPGFLEPSHTKDTINAIPNLGAIPAADKSNLVAAFNGGFKAVNGRYGMMVNGVTLLSAVPGIATLAIYRDGHIQIGAWGQDILPTADIVSFRQNCPLIIQNGQLNPQVSVDNRAIWGDTIGNQEVTWRTGIGLTQDGRYLIYAVGNATTVATLAQALQAAGAYNAMQLDINQNYAHFATYQYDPSHNPVRADQLLKQMTNEPKIFLAPSWRDFFYLTQR